MKKSLVIHVNRIITMNIKKSVSLIVLALTTSSVYANTDRDVSYSPKNLNQQDVQHIRTTNNYVPQALTKSVKSDNRELALSLVQPSLSKTTASKSLMAAVDNNECSSSVFTSLTGTAFLQALRDNGKKCIDTLFNDRPETLKLGAYSDANLTTVINEIKFQISTYDGTDPDGYLSAMFYWLRAYAYYDNRRFVTPASQQLMEEAVNALYINSHFFDKTVEHALVVRSAMGIFKNAQIAGRFMHILKGVLSRYDESYEDTSNWGAAASPLFWDTLKACASDATCRAQEHNVALINLITGFINNNLNWLKKPDNDYHLFNLGYQLVELHRGENDAHFPAMESTLKARINNILDTSGPLKTDNARTLYMAVFESIGYNRVCTTYNMCDKKADLITSVLNDRMVCPSGTLSIWAQDMTQAQLAWTCNSLEAHESHFHTTLQTNEIPVTPDDNDKLQMAIFNDKKEWVTYGGALFNANTNNGGTYLEGDPSNGVPEATFYAYEHVSERPIFDVWNLRHEYIHYLEGRFISKGSFRDSDSAGRTVWFGEGIAEYISLRDCNEGAIAEARKGDYDLSTIFKNEYGVGQTRIYDWGYLSNRYMFERENANFFSMLNLFKQGNFQDYRTQLVDSWVNNKSFDNDFSNWLTTVESTGCTVDNTRPPSPVEPINIDDIQGNEQPGINACALGRPPEEHEIPAGKAICLADTNNNRNLQLAFNAKQGLVNVTLEITLRHGSGNADLVHRWDKRPRSNEYDNVSNGPTNNETILVENVKPGWNYINVGANSEFSGTTLLARYIQNDVTVDDNVLENGVAKLVSGVTRGETIYTMTVPAGASNLSFKTSGGSGDVDMHVKFASEPTKSNYDCRPWKVGSTEACNITNAQAGTYFIMLLGHNNFTDVNLIGSYTP